VSNSKTDMQAAVWELAFHAMADLDKAMARGKAKDCAQTMSLMRRLETILIWTAPLSVDAAVKAPKAGRGVTLTGYEVPLED
jgi:hypothetical protein